jgi:muramidase (phage lysozyme)
MDKNVPAGAAMLLDLIAGPESGGNYNAYFAHARSTKDLSKMTLDEVERWSRNRGTRSSATGRYQFMRDTLDKPGTLKDLSGEMGLTGKELFTPDLQDRMAYKLLIRRGYLLFVAGKISATTFGLNLAKEWASFPVLADTKGAHQPVKRGQSYYAGDALNRAGISPAKVEAALKLARSLPSTARVVLPPIKPDIPPPAAKPAPARPATLAGFFARLVAFFTPRKGV